MNTVTWNLTPRESEISVFELVRSIVYSESRHSDKVHGRRFGCTMLRFGTPIHLYSEKKTRRVPSQLTYLSYRPHPFVAYVFITERCEMNDIRQSTMEKYM